MERHEAWNSGRRHYVYTRVKAANILGLIGSLMFTPVARLLLGGAYKRVEHALN